MAFLAWTKKSFHSLVDFVLVGGLRRMMKESLFFQLVKSVFTSTIIGNIFFPMMMAQPLVVISHFTLVDD